MFIVFVVFVIICAALYFLTIKGKVKVVSHPVKKVASRKASKKKGRK